VEKTGEWGVWQLLDSTFPTGGFAHSGGVEAAWQQGWVRTSAELEAFVLESVKQAAHGVMPFVEAVYAGRAAAELDHYLDTMLPNHVANRASRAQGHALISTAERVFGGEAVGRMRLEVMAERQPGHWGVMFGVVMRELGIAREQAMRMLLFLQMRGVFSAAVRLGAVGPLEAQRLQAGMAAGIETCMDAARELKVEEAAQCSPLLELWQLSQDRLYSRLFQS